MCQIFHARVSFKRRLTFFSDERVSGAQFLSSSDSNESVWVLRASVTKCVSLLAYIMCVFAQPWLLSGVTEY